MTTLALVFVDLTLAAGSTTKAVPALIVLVLGLGTKETAVAYPVLALVTVGAAARRRGPRRSVLAVEFVVAVAFAMWRLSAGSVPQDYWVLPDRYALKELLVRPFAALAVPWTAHELDQHPLLGWLAGVGVLGATATCLCFGSPTRLRPRWMPFGVAWVLVSAAPVYRYFFIGADLQGSRYLYLPAVGWCILLAGLLGCSLRFRGAKRLAAAAVVGLVAAGSWGIRAHLEDWKTAAAPRDRVLASAGHLLRTPACGSVRFEGVPDSAGGAYVLRNGFAEAIALHFPADATRLEGPEPVCVFAWDSAEERFRPWNGRDPTGPAPGHRQ